MFCWDKSHFVAASPFDRSRQHSKRTYVRPNSTLLNAKLEYGNLVVDNDRLALRMAKNVELCGVHIGQWKVVANFKDKLSVRSALYKNKATIRVFKRQCQRLTVYFLLPSIG